LNKDKVLLFDGAFGTYYNKLTNKNINCELSNINDTELVYRIHKEYISAGVNAIKTNTYGANALLSEDEALVLEIIKKGYEIAKRAVLGTDVLIFADIGNIFGEDISKQDEYEKITQAFIQIGAKNFLFETLSDFEPIKSSISLIRKSVKDCKIIVSFAVKQDGYTKTGFYYKTLIDDAKNYGADYIGINCLCGPSHMYNLIKQLNLEDFKLSVMPNSAYPVEVNGRMVFKDNPEYFAEKLLQMYLMGVCAIGGCCGTTPEHIKAAIAKINQFSNGNPLVIKPQKDKPSKEQQKPLNERKYNQTIIAVEIGSPVDTDTEYILSAAKAAKTAGADFITIADSPLARARADSFMTAAKIKREVGIDVIPHLSCRDRNQISIKGTLISANIEDINNVLVITGDPITQTERTECRGVFSFNSTKLISYINNLNGEVFSKSPFSVCGALNINAVNFEAELTRAEQKVQSGANFLFTQPIFNQKNIDNYLLAKSRLSCKIIAGIMPVASYNNAMFLNNEVSGIEIPDSLIKELKDKTPKETKKISVDFCKEIINKIRDGCNGYYLMTPLKKIDFVCEIIKYIRSI